MLRGSRWPTADFIFAGALLPLPFAWLIARVSRYRIRFPSLLALSVILGAILTTAWIGKHPNPNTAFSESLQMPVPDGVRDLSAECGWYDGRITILRFTSNPAVIRSLLPADALVVPIGHDPANNADGLSAEESWRRAVRMGAIIDGSLSDFPKWKGGRQAEWMRPSPSVDTPRALSAVWDESTGRAVICIHED